MRDDWSSADFVEALSSAGIDNFMLGTLPEAVLAPLQEAIVQCQAEPPTTWSKDLLAIVGRGDVNMLLTPGSHAHNSQPSALLVCHYPFPIVYSLN
jgi:anaphase-promoting complex subunit 1